MTREKAQQIRALYFSRQMKQHELAAMFGIRQQPDRERANVGMTPAERRRGQG